MPYYLIKRIIDILLSSIGLVLISPLFLIIGCSIIIESGFPIFFTQIRVGKHNHTFKLYKFRSMFLYAEAKGQLTIGTRDNRITKVGLLLRKYKLDELPQLLNVLKGEMSLVGPRPEVPKYVNLYTREQLHVLNVKPGITDYASIRFINENEILGKSNNPEQTYISEIMPEKLRINLEYIQNLKLKTDFIIIFLTFARLFRLNK